MLCLHGLNAGLQKIQKQVNAGFQNIQKQVDFPPLLSPILIGLTEINTPWLCLKIRKKRVQKSLKIFVILVFQKPKF